MFQIFIAFITRLENIIFFGADSFYEITETVHIFLLEHLAKKHLIFCLRNVSVKTLKNFEAS